MCDRKEIRKAVRQQLGYVRRNLAHIDTLITAGEMLPPFPVKDYIMARSAAPLILGF